MVVQEEEHRRIADALVIPPHVLNRLNLLTMAEEEVLVIKHRAGFVVKMEQGLVGLVIGEHLVLLSLGAMVEEDRTEEEVEEEDFLAVVVEQVVDLHMEVEVEVVPLMLHFWMPAPLL